MVLFRDVVNFSPVEYAGFGCLALSMVAAVAQGVVMRAEFDSVTERSRFDRQRHRLISLGAVELTLLSIVIVISAVENLQEQAEWYNVFWVAWVAFAVECVELAGETLAHVVKVEDHHQLRHSYNMEFRADPRSRRVKLNLYHRLGFRAAALVVFSSLFLSTAFVILAFFREKGTAECSSRAIAKPMLILWSVVAFLCSSCVLTALLLARRNWVLFRNQLLTDDRMAVFELVLSMIEAVPAILIMSLALRLMSRDDRRGCITLGRKLGSIGLVLELGPVAKAGRQIAARYWPVEKHVGAAPTDSPPAVDSHLVAPVTIVPTGSSGLIVRDSDSADPTLPDSNLTESALTVSVVVAIDDSPSGVEAEPKQEGETAGVDNNTRSDSATGSSSGSDCDTIPPPPPKPGG